MENIKNKEGHNSCLRADTHRQALCPYGKIILLMVMIINGNTNNSNP